MTGILLKGRYKYYAGTHVGLQLMLYSYLFISNVFLCPLFHEVLAYCNRRPEKKVKTNRFFIFCLKMFRPCSRLWAYCKIFCQLNMKDVFVNKQNKKKHCLVQDLRGTVKVNTLQRAVNTWLVYKERAASTCRIVHLKTSKKGWGNNVFGPAWLHVILGHKEHPSSMLSETDG